jgi:hypothetical protein
MKFIKVDTTDANRCIYNIYYINKSDSTNFYVPISAEFITNNNQDTTYCADVNCRYLNLKKRGKFQSIWLPDSILSNLRFLGSYKAHCDSTKIIFKLGASDCYSKDSIILPCHICQCTGFVNLTVAPISPYTMCKLIPLISQTYTLSSGQHCKYYGLNVTGGFTPTDNQVITSLSIPFNATTPIDFTTYNRWIPDPFMNIYCYPTCTYNLHYAFTNIDNDVVANKDFSIMIDNSSIPINIIPSGLLSSQCYSMQPHKISIPSEELHFEEMVIVDPNPTTGKANVRLNLKESLIGRLVLYSSTGEQIQEIHNGKLSSGFTDYGIDLSSQPSGMYIITIETDEMQYIKKFIKE